MNVVARLLAWALFPFLSFCEIFVGCLLFARHQPRRDGFARHIVAVLSCFALVALVIAAAAERMGALPGVDVLPGALPYPSTASAIAVETIGFGLFLVAMLPALISCFELNGWSALFCATAGYALQNFGSGLGELALQVSSALGRPLLPGSAGLLGLICCALVFLVAWRLPLSDVTHADLDTLTNRSLLPMLTVVFLAVIGFDVVLKSEAFAALAPATRIMTRVLHCIFCLFTLFVEVEMVVRQQLAIMVATSQRLMAEREHQLQLSRENIDAINLKCHDLRHQIRHLADGGTAVDAGALADIAREISVYDSAVRTGNQALDTILTEKRLLAERADITLTCVADGTVLSFMAPADLYALFGNALDNALEAVEALPDSDRRSISLLVRERAGMAQIHVENTCAGTVTLTDGLPMTTKLASDGTPDTTAHGFGTRSMRSIVERYGGTLTLTPKDGIFALDVMLPLP